MKRRINEIRDRHEADAEELVRMSGVNDYEIEHARIYLLGNHVEVEVIEGEDGKYFVSDFNTNQGYMSSEEEADEALTELRRVYNAVKRFKNVVRNKF
jgi:hypothetical protein